MKVTIEYLKTGHIETRENVDRVYFVNGRMAIESETQVSVFWQDDNVEVTVQNN